MLTVISLGGSIIVPNEVDVNFLKKFREVILKHVKKGDRFIIVTGGGKVCRKYQNSAKEITDVSKEDLDWIGIYATRLNAQLLRSLFKGYVHKKILEEYDKFKGFKEKILIASGWEPGWSKDYDAVLLADTYNAKVLIKLTNVDYIYDKDPKKFKSAKPFKELSWTEVKKLVTSEWKPGLNFPFDPVASRLAEKSKLIVVSMKGVDNLDKFLDNKKFEGTVIS